MEKKSRKLTTSTTKCNLTTVTLTYKCNWKDENRWNLVLKIFLWAQSGLIFCAFTVLIVQFLTRRSVSVWDSLTGLRIHLPIIIAWRHWHQVYPGVTRARLITCTCGLLAPQSRIRKWMNLGLWLGLPIEPMSHSPWVGVGRGKIPRPWWDSNPRPPGL